MCMFECACEFFSVPCVCVCACVCVRACVCVHVCSCCNLQKAKRGPCVQKSVRALIGFEFVFELSIYSLDISFFCIADTNCVLCCSPTRPFDATALDTNVRRLTPAPHADMNFQDYISKLRASVGGVADASASGDAPSQAAASKSKAKKNKKKR